MNNEPCEARTESAGDILALISGLIKSDVSVRAAYVAAASGTTSNNSKIRAIIYYRPARSR